MSFPTPALFALLLAFGLGAGCAGEDRLGVRDVPDPNAPETTDASDAGAPAAKTAVATFGGGCFWCTEAVFEEVEGVVGVVSGYAGGATEDPTYEAVCAGITGHAEVVQVTYDPTRVAYADLLRIFFATHDPTTLDRQGADVGTQYRSIILHHDDEQKAIAEKVKAELEASGEYTDPIVTEIVALDRFYEAEAYHQDYFAQNPEKGYCRVVIRPKVDKFRRSFSDRLK